MARRGDRVITGQTVTQEAPDTYLASTGSTKGAMAGPVEQPAPTYTTPRAYPVEDRRPGGTGGLTAGLTLLGLLTILLGAWAASSPISARASASTPTPPQLVLELGPLPYAAS
jgi:hypothetical protein